MKVVCILGSPHGMQGNTGGLLSLVLDGVYAAGGKADLVLLDGKNVKPCLGCDNCHKSGRCPQDDSFETILQTIKDADGLILASPNYIFNVSAQMKAFMDRCCGVIHCLAFEGKYGLAIATSGGSSEDPIIEYMSRFLLVTGTRPAGGMHVTMASLPDGEFTGKIRAQARDLGVHLVKAWRAQESDPVVEEAMDAFRDRMRQLVTYRKEDWVHEYSYWQQHHGLH